MLRLTFAFALFAFIFAPSAFAQDDMTAEIIIEPVATVIEIEGTASVNNELADNTPLEIDTPIFEDDEIFTGPESKVLLLFLDDTELTIGEDAHAFINDFTYEPEDDEQKSAHLSFLRGAFLFVSGKVGKINKPDVNLETPYASIGIRGTVVWGGTLDDQYNIFVKEGAVSVRNERGAMMVREGQGTTLTDRRTFPTKSKLWGEEKINRAVSTIALAQQEQIQTRLKERRGTMLEQRKARRANPKIDNRPENPRMAPSDETGENEEEQKETNLNNRSDKTGVNSNLKEKAERSKKARNKIREEEFQKRMDEQKRERYNK